jgi:hypothetical protein
MKLLRRVLLGAFSLLLLNSVLFAETNDPPGRVARLQYMSGSVSVQPGGTNDWVAGTINRPLTTSDNVWTDKDSRAELSLGTAFLRMDDQTSVTLTNLNDGTVQLQLHQGTLNLRVRRLYRGEIYEIDTPNIAFTVLKAGEYRFDVNPAGDVTLVTVRKGEGDVTSNGPVQRVHSNQQARFANETLNAFSIYAAPPRDAFDDWAHVRDSRLDQSVSAEYVAPGTIGYEDLDSYGSWHSVPTYGSIWVPVVAASWAPYRYGHWLWVSPWGWTWVDDAAWGFAPFHYGRWVWLGYWAWVPGPPSVRPYYAPALVAWFGGPGFGFNFGFGYGTVGYGWCPLGYGEPYFPWYYGSSGYFRNVNVSNTYIKNVTYITNNYYGNKGPRRPEPIHYANLQAPDGLTAADQKTIFNSRPVNVSHVPISPEIARTLAQAPVTGKLPIEPQRESVLGVNAGKPAPSAPERIQTRPVISKLPPPHVDSRPLPATASAAPPKIQGDGAAAAPVREIDRNDGLSAARQVPRPPASPETAGAGHGVPQPPVPDQPVPAKAPARYYDNDSLKTVVGNQPEPVPHPPAGENRGSVTVSVAPQPGEPANSGDARTIGVDRNVPRPPDKPQTPSPHPARPAAPAASVPRPVDGLPSSATGPDEHRSPVLQNGANPVSANPVPKPPHDVPRPAPGRTVFDSAADQPLQPDRPVAGRAPIEHPAYTPPPPVAAPPAPMALPRMSPPPMAAPAPMAAPSAPASAPHMSAPAAPASHAATPGAPAGGVPHSNFH